MLSSSKRARVIDEKKSTPSKSESISIEVWVDEERVRFARSQAVRRRRMARGLPVMSFLCCESGKRRGGTGRVSIGAERDGSSEPVLSTYLALELLDEVVDGAVVKVLAA